MFVVIPWYISGYCSTVSYGNEELRTSINCFVLLFFYFLWYNKQITDIPTYRNFKVKCIKDGLSDVNDTAKILRYLYKYVYETYFHVNNV